MIKLDGGIQLPLPSNMKHFKIVSNITRSRRETILKEVWHRAYTHCLYALHTNFNLPIHYVVHSISRNMYEVHKGSPIALRFLGEMLLAGYIKLYKRKVSGNKWERVVVPTRQLVSLSLGVNVVETSAIRLPIIEGEKGWNEVTFPIRGGSLKNNNKEKIKIVSDIAKQTFVVNDFILEVLSTHPPDMEFNICDEYKIARCLTSARQLQHKVFRFRNYVDSRGRVYPDVTCCISPQGSDFERSMILPYEAVPLTKAGFKSFYKATKDYAQKDWCMKDILRHAKDWKTDLGWQQADKPYSYLSCANTLRQYIDDPTQPLRAYSPLDGRCSGLQHWSALVRSDAITKHLGMEVDESSLDLYEYIAMLWKDTLEEKYKKYANRKSAKVPTMTWGYNARPITSMRYLHELYGVKYSRIAGEEEVIREGLTRSETARLGVDLYNSLNKTLGVLSSAVAWVGNCATLLSKKGILDIYWVTPDGFTGKQRKLKGTRNRIQVILHDGSKLEVGTLTFSNEPDSKKHKAALAPNIIHSLDANHLREVARRLVEEGIPAVYVHDSFSTHSNHTERLYEIIIEEFIKLYSIDYLKELKQYWEDTYRIELPKLPEYGNYKIETLRLVKHFFI